MARDKYKDWISEEGITLIQGWARNGLTDEQIADKIGISRSTLNVWRERFADIADALKKGKDFYDDKAEEALINRGFGYNYIETTYEFQYNEEADEWEKIPVKAIEKHMPADVGALCFWLKNRRKDKWRDKPDTDNSRNDDTLTLNIVFPD